MNRERVYGLMDLATKLMIINFLWFLSILSGFVVLTIFPATAALFICVQKQLERSLPYSEITKVFFKTMFSNFMKFTVIGLVSTLFFLILSSNFLFILNFNKVALIKMLLQPIMIFIGILGLIVFVNIFIVNVYHNYGVKELLMESFKSGLRIPFNGMARSLVLVVVAFIVFMFPGLLPVISMSVVAVLSVWLFPKPHLQ